MVVDNLLPLLNIELKIQVKRNSKYLDGLGHFQICRITANSFVLQIGRVGCCMPSIYCREIISARVAIK